MGIDMSSAMGGRVVGKLVRTAELRLAVGEFEGGEASHVLEERS